MTGRGTVLSLLLASCALLAGCSSGLATHGGPALGSASGAGTAAASSATSVLTSSASGSTIAPPTTASTPSNSLMPTTHLATVTQVAGNPPYQVTTATTTVNYPDMGTTLKPLTDKPKSAVAASVAYQTFVKYGLDVNEVAGRANGSLYLFYSSAGPQGTLVWAFTAKMKADYQPVVVGASRPADDTFVDPPFRNCTYVAIMDGHTGAGITAGVECDPQ